MGEAKRRGTREQRIAQSQEAAFKESLRQREAQREAQRQREAEEEERLLKTFSSGTDRDVQTDQVRPRIGRRLGASSLATALAISALVVK